MSTERNPLVSSTNNDISVTSFSGGAARGPCLQLGQEGMGYGRQMGHMYIQVDVDQAIAMRDMLESFLTQPSAEARRFANAGVVLPTPYEDMAARMDEEDES